MVYRHLEHAPARHQEFLARVHKPITSHASATTVKTAQRDGGRRRFP
jgi:hypothetical protein